MSSRLSTSQPVTIETELIPLVDNFWLEANGQTEQWYYDNTGEYAPDRSIIPLIITPYIKATDTDSQTSYTPNFYTVEWYVQQWNGTAWVRTKVTNTTDTPANPFVIVGNTLKVNKNVESPQYGITIDCEATYIDPRDAGVTYPVRDSLTLSMNNDATVPYPEIQVLAESAQSFNPLKDSSAYDFKAEADWKGVSADNGSQLYKADALGTEEIVSRTGTLPTTTPIIGNLRYGRGTGSTLKENQSFMFRQTSGGTVTPVPDSIAGIEKLKGNTVVWNQILQNGNFVDATGWNVQNGSLSISNNTAVVQLTAAPATDWNTYIRKSPAISAISGHVYLITCYVKNPKGSTFVMDCGGNGRVVSVTANAWSKCVWRGTVNNAQNNLVMSFYPELKTQGYENGDTYEIKDIQVFDLTLMFGSGNEPTTVAEFEAMFPEPYYAYDAGRLLSFNPAGLKTVGFNLFDKNDVVRGYIIGKNGQSAVGTWCYSNYIRVYPNTQYYYKNLPSSYLGNASCVYDKNKNFLSYLNINGSTTTPQSAIVTTPNDAYYIRINCLIAWLDDVCVSLSDASKNGTYEAHWENTCPIDITALKGRATGSTTDVVMFPDGLKSAGSVFDEIDLKNGRAVKRIGKVLLSTAVAAVYNNGSHYYGVTNPIQNLKPQSQTNAISLLECGYTGDQVSGGAYGIGYRGNSAQLAIALRSEPTTLAAFKSALDGVMLYYELETPIEYTFDPIPQGQFEWYGVSNGVEVRIDTLPSYVSGQGTDTLRVDALYDENMTVICRYKKYPWDSELIPQKEYRTVAWRVPNIDTIIVCKNGSSVNSASTGSYTFETIVNVKGEMISDQVKAANLRFRWKMRKSNTTTETDLGWGLTKSIPVSDLKSTVVNGNPVSTIVYCEVYLLGAYEPVTNNGVTTYERTIDLS